MTITREQIIAWARESDIYGMHWSGVWEHPDLLEHFAALIEQAVRADEQAIIQQALEALEDFDYDKRQAAIVALRNQLKEK